MSGKMTKIINDAETNGYAGVAAKSGRSYKRFGCQPCRKNTAIKLVHVIEAKAILACICGWRKKVSV
jgi:hypothetical protein